MKLKQPVRAQSGKLQVGGTTEAPLPGRTTSASDDNRWASASSDSQLVQFRAGRRNGMSQMLQKEMSAPSGLGTATAGAEGGGEGASAIGGTRVATEGAASGEGLIPRRELAEALG